MIEISRNSECFLVSNDFVDTYLCEANGSFVKVYLYLLRHSNTANLEMTDISNALNLLESDVIRAFKYWQKMGLLHFSKHSDKDFSIEFADKNSDCRKRNSVNDEQNPPQKSTVPKISSNPTAVTYTKSDITTYMKNNDGIRHMFLISEQLLNRPLTETDRKILFGFYDYLEMPVEVIFTLIEHCISKGKTNMRYIEKVAYTWADKEINTLEKASIFVKEENEFSLLLKKYKSMFKIVGRELTDTEETYIRTWVYELKADDNKIYEAYETTVTNTGKIAFKYLDAVLRNSLGSVSGKNIYTEKSSANQRKNFFQDYDNEISDFEVEMIKNRVNNK